MSNRWRLNYDVAWNIITHGAHIILRRGAGTVVTNEDELDEMNLMGTIPTYCFGNYSIVSSDSAD